MPRKLMTCLELPLADMCCFLPFGLIVFVIIITHMWSFFVFVLLVDPTLPALGFNLGVGEGHIQCRDSERQALLNFKQGLVDNDDRLSSWGSEEGKRNCCKWTGIQCSRQTGHVTMLDLHVSDSELGDNNKPLRGKINHSLLELQHLNYLDLSYNDFQGILLPDFNGSLSKLRYLNFSNVGFTGTLSYQLRNLSSLQSLDLSYNKFTKVEKLDWLSHLSYLETLDLSGNSLGDGSDWARIVTKFPYLTKLQLRSCGIATIIPLSNSHANSSTSLSVLDLSSNYLSSSVFQWVFSLNSSLVHVNISFNQLEGTIPSLFGNFCRLRTLDLAGNKLTGPLPVVLEHLSACAESSLEILKLEMNRLHGSLPDFTGFSSLRELIVFSNQLNGSFPNSFSQNSGLIVLDVGGNQLTGSLPDLTMFPSLRILCIAGNRLNGTFTESIGGLSELELLYASHNFFQGEITEAHFSNLSRLQELYFNDNPLALEFNSDWLPPFQLDVIGLMSCKLGPRFPAWLQTQKNFSVLDISDAEISGSVPKWFWNLPPRLFFLNISFNKLSGVVPDLSSKFIGSPGVDLSSNLFEGPLPLLPSNALSLNLAKNKFMGSISPVCKVIGWALNFLDLSDNLLSGVLADDCFRNGQQLIVLNLADNNFSGNIPTSVGSLSMLQTFGLRNNSFSGEIPLSLKNCSRLRFLDLSYNRLSGEIPAWIGESQLQLVFFSLQSNEFHGNIPLQLCRLQNILLLDLSMNNISGAVPNCLKNFTHMSRNQLDNNNNTYVYAFSTSSGEGNGFVGNYVDRALIGWKGRSYTFDKNLPLLRIINLAENKLSGEIPREITSLLAMGGLNLSRNYLTGIIPQEIGQLKQLQWLDLSRNRLSGDIPGSMAELNFLSYADLSYNNLSGRIPTSTQLQSLDASAFAGNVNLCGLPLIRNCPADEERPQVGQKNDDDQDNQEDDDEFRNWLFGGLGCGFFVGFWGVLGFSVQRPSWRLGSGH